MLADETMSEDELNPLFRILKNMMSQGLCFAVLHYQL